MPGIFGLVSRQPKEAAAERLQFMLSSAPHRAAQQSGSISIDSLGCHLGWTTLTGSFSDCLPVWNEKKTCLLVFIGEHCSDKEDIAFLKSKNHVIRKADASHLVHLYEEYGPGFIERLNGWFSGVLIDLNKGRGYIFNDRFGGGQLYSLETSDGFNFASHPKSLTAIDPSRKSLNQDHVAGLLTGAPLFGQTQPFPSLTAVPPGSCWEFDLNGVDQRTRYFDPDSWQRQPALGEDYFVEKTKETLTRILPRYLKSDSNLGLLLAGEPGAEMILGLSELPHGKVPFYTFAHRSALPPDRDPDLAKIAGQSHDFIAPHIESADELLADINEAVIAGNGNTTVDEISLLTLARALASRTPSLLCGLHWGAALLPEAIAKDHPHKSDSTIIDPEFLAKLELRAATNGHVVKPGAQTLFGKNTVASLARLTGVRSYLNLRTPFFDLEFLQLALRLPLVSQNRSKVAESLISACKPPSASSKTASSRIQGKIDWLARSFVTPPQAPRDTMSWDLGPPRAQAMSNASEWFYAKWSPALRDILLDTSTLGRPFLVKQEVERCVNEHYSGKADHSTILGRILVTEMACRALSS